MIHTVIIDGKSYDLPKKTLVIAGKLDDVLRVDSANGLSVRQKYEKLHTFVKDILGQEESQEIFGTSILDEVDLSELTIITRKIIDGYERPITEYQIEQNMAKINNLPMRQLESITKMAEAVAKNK